MKWLALLSLLVLADPSPETRYFHFARPLAPPASSAGQTCAIVDPAVFANAAPSLADLRLYQGAQETPYTLRSQAPLPAASQNLTVLNLGKSGEQTVFDAAMPATSYSDVELNLTGRDFLATVTVTGSQQPSGAPVTRLGDFTIFDLTRQRLGRSTVLHLPPSNFPYLHFEIAGPIPPQSVNGLTVTGTSALQPRYVAVAQTAAVTQKGRDSVFTFTVPPRTPADRVVFVPGPQPASFSRNVRIEALPNSRPNARDDAGPPPPATNGGNILRVHRIQDGRHIDNENLSIDAPQAGFDTPSIWTVTIENGDDTPVPMTAVRIEMIERDLCFDAARGAAYTLYYGDSALSPPQYDYAALFVPAPNPAAAELAAEVANPAWQPRPDTRPFTEKHPGLLWAALLLVIALLGAVAIRSVKSMQNKPPTS